jgi:hypothetical protein
MEKPAMTNKQQTLERKIVDVLQPDTDITSADVAELIEEAESGIAKAEKEGTVDQTLSLDPKAARQAIADATFAANRLRMLLSKLQVRYAELRADEEATAWLAELDAFKPERDALAGELRELYPDAVAQIVDLFVRIKANDEALSDLLQKRPPGVMEHLLSAELHARGLDSFSRDMPSLLTSVHLVDWDSGREIWPPPRPSMASAFAATAIPGNDRRFTGDWAKDNEQRAAAQQAERQRMADFYRRLDQEQEDRENAEARERFLAQQEQLTVNRPLKSRE